GKDVSGGPAAARSMRERHPILSHRSRPMPDAAGRAAPTLATAAFPQPAPGLVDAAALRAAQASPARFRLRARRPGTYGALL
ncbi:MAG TPA: hypothetical protein VF070_10390, partial [Streptosporangiaceae bacterium]